MSEFTTIMARDGHEFRAWLAPPAGRPRGAIVVVQEIFGVNGHIRSVTDGYAKEGYVAIAPCLFDRVRRGIELGYSAAEMQEGRGYAQQLKPEQVLADLAAAIAVVKNSGRVGSRRLLLGRKDRVSWPPATSHRLRGRLLRRQHHAGAQEAAEVSGHVPLRRARCAHPA
jgi:dienelactone hydrolase